MKIQNAIRDVKGIQFPAGRRTRVLIGVDSKLQAEHFVQGLVVIDPKGKIPLHNHVTEETYFIISGNGIMTVDDEKREVGPNDIVYITPKKPHSLETISDIGDLKMMFVYAPKMVVDPWDKEKILVHEIRTGVIKTDMTSTVKEKYDGMFYSGVFPIPRWIEPEDVA